MRLKWKKLVHLVICLTIASVLVFGLNGNGQQNGSLFLWPELRSETPIRPELSPDRKLIQYPSPKHNEPGGVIRRVRDDLSLGEIILDTNNRRKERKELEMAWWMAGNKLLVYLIEGVTDEEELEYRLALHSENPEAYPAPSFKLVVLDPFTGEETPFPVTVDYGTPVIPHPDKDKVLIVQDDATVLYSFPDAKELARVTVEHGLFLEWCPDKQRFWGLVAYLSDNNLDWVVRIVVTDIMKNQSKVLLEKEWNNELYSIKLEPIGEDWGMDRIENLGFLYYDHAFLVEGREIAILVYKTKADKLAFIYFSSDGIARERELNEKMLPDALKQLGECWVIEMLPNGKELLIRQGDHNYSDQIFQKCWYWLWNMDSGEVKRIGYFGELEVIEWLGQREAMVEIINEEDINGEKRIVYDYGILRLP